MPFLFVRYVMLDFKEIKQIRITDVLGRYHVPLKFKGVWATCICPLPTHKAEDKGRNFSVNVAQNYWRCFSESCNTNNGGKKGGDVINLVALLEKCRESEAAQKLATWYGVGEKKDAPRMERRGLESSSKATSQKDSSEHNPPSDSVKYMQAIDAWFDELFRRGEKEADCDYWKRTRNGVKAKLIESFRNGKRQAQGLPVAS